MYELDLLERIKILYIWYISVLETAHKNILLMTDTLDIDPESQEKVWEVKKILDLDLINNG